MNKISIYILLILIYLGISKSFSPTIKKSIYIKNKNVYAHYFKGIPLSILLIDAFKTGFLIKTYFHKYKIIYGHKPSKILTSRVSKKYWYNSKPFLGMSVFRRIENNNHYTESVIPMPPGVIYLNDPIYGRWRYVNSGEKLWTFHIGYKHFPNIFGWINFIPNFYFYKAYSNALRAETPFFGINKEFGTSGVITKKFLNNIQIPVKNLKRIENHLKKFIGLPWPSNQNTIPLKKSGPHRNTK